MQESSEETNDSLSASSTTNLFELPENVLRNLTPAKKSNFKNKNHRVRKQQIIRTKTLKLKKRSEIINQKIQNLKLNQEIISNKIARDLSENLRLANERRMAFLEKKREKARNIQLTTLKLPIVLSPSIRISTSNENGIEYKNKDIRSVIIIQRNIRKYILIQNVEYLKKFKVLSKLRSLTYAESLLILNPQTEFVKTVISILRNLEMPDILPKKKYKSFLYSLILIADYNDSLDQHTHSGFNTNIEDKNINNLVNSISLLLFKLAQSVLYEFVKFIHCDRTELKNPWSISKLKLCKSWKIYHFLFQIFRTLHFNNCMVIINDALRIVQKQLSICNAAEIEIQKENYVKNYKFLTRLSEVFHFSKTEWAYFGQESRDFINSIKCQVFDRTILERPKVRASLDLLDELDKTIDNPSNHTIVFEHVSFSVPPKIPVYKWRKYWINQYRGQRGPISNDRYGIPQNLKSGFFNQKNEFKLSNIYVENVLRELDMEPIHSKYDILLKETDINSIVVKFEHVICEVFFILFEYCIKFEDNNNSEGYDIAMAQFSQLKYSYKVSNYNNHAELIQYFKLHFYCLNHLTSIGPFAFNFVPDACSKFIDRLNHMTEVSACEFESFIIFYKELEILAMDLWLQKCKFKGILYMKQFENVCQFISKRNFKIENGTNSPHLRFPLFYNFLSKYDSNFNRHMLNYHSIIESAFEYPNFDSFVMQRSSFNYFQQVFINYVLRGLTNPQKQCDENSVNEFSEFFNEELRAVTRKCYQLIISNCVLHLILNYYSSTQTHFNKIQIFSSTFVSQCAEMLSDHFKDHYADPNIENFVPGMLNACPEEQHLKLDLDRLIRYIQIEYAKLLKDKGSSLLRDILLKKFEKLIKTEPSSLEFQSLLRGNFRYFVPQTMLVIAEINGIINEIYDLYSPLLNWIYKDIGEPSI